MNETITANSRIPRHDLDAEMSVLSAALLDAEALDRVAALPADTFYAPAHRRIWEAILSLREKGEPIDTGTVVSELRRRERLADVGGAPYLAKVVDAVPATAHVEAYARTVREFARQRDVVSIAQRIAAEGYGDVGDVRMWASACADQLEALTRVEGARRTLATIGEAIRETFGRLARGEAAAGPRIRSGIHALDEVLAMHLGDLVIIAGRPKMGKSAIAGGIAVAAAGTELETLDERCGVLVCSAEMPREQLAQRYVCSGARFEVGRLRRGDIPVEAWGRLTDAAKALDGLPLFVDDKGAPTVGHVRAMFRAANREIARTDPGARIRVVVVDYLQIMGTRHVQGRSRAEEIAEITKALKAFALDENVLVVLLSQLNRELEKRPNKRPVPSDLRDSGAIEQDADSVLFVYRDEVYHPNTRAKGRAELLVELQRNGGPGRAIVAFEGAFTMFRELTAEEERQLQQEHAEERDEGSRPRRRSRWEPP